MVRWVPRFVLIGRGLEGFPVPVLEVPIGYRDAAMLEASRVMCRPVSCSRRLSIAHLASGAKSQGGEG